jgi:NitT/TauT family transport system substrate-binding protein
MLVAVLLVAGAGTWLWQRRSGRSLQGRVAVSFAYIPIADAAPLYVALDQKLFERHGIEPMVTEMRGGPLIIEAVAAGHADVGFANTLSFLLARAAGVPMLPIGAVQVVDREHVRAALLVRPDAGIDSVTQLRGRRIAVNAARNIVELALRKVLVQAGVDTATVRFVEVPFPQMENALRGGSVDAVPLAEPYWTFAGERGDLKVVSYYLGDAWPVLEIAGWFTLSDWRQQHAQTAAAVEAVFRDAVDWLRQPANEASARQIIGRYTGTDSLTAANMSFPTFQMGFTLERLRELVEDMTAHRFLDRPLVVDSTLLAPAR